ncbi:tRNA (adenine(58)-N(1))-methyltransferase catalytic subunit TRM61, putative [Plasmodium gallinaceum]|uniref:tRNA (adenine(58)-N(1))-methyltransferase n=1 Tax=Plasmodium gallinaceum TaxID=5849 RepID=A0A1J1H1Y7_PLAGA|nr:tRNA (adenine(58)-N(1))-methyltransferase catalytic subunit TRM61, putative [Plasmodium gallinaceum]CRG97547.1 tRNA (adenine(58)-N(1))-methyltransferase catalytic subunit TRM61, putative [Plasmodium gallinaceum]
MTIKEDSVILYFDEDNIELVKLKKDEITINKKGTFLHNDIIGKEYGSKIFDTLNKNFIYVLKRSPELIALSLKKTTQTLYEHDISFICLLCNALPNKKILEAGTGSGCLTYALANCVLPHGKIYTFEYNEERYKEVKKEFENFDNVKNNINFYHKDIINSDFEDFICDIDSVFLDMPNPWLCVEKIKKVLKERGIFVIFLPSIEQVHKVIDSLEYHSFCEIITYELINKSWQIMFPKNRKNIKNENETTDVNNQSTSTKGYYINSLIPNYRLFQKENKTHTGYLTVAKKPLDDENDQIDIEFKNIIE